ncbi:MAG: M56 family metallopeptidase [Planctomycetota bacterium]
MNQVINTCITDLNSIGRGFWDYAAGMFIQSSVLIVILLVIDFLLRKRARAVFRYCLWMLVFVKLVLPASLTLPTGIGYWAGSYFESETSMVQLMPPIEEANPIAIERQEDFVPLVPAMVEEAAAGAFTVEPICWEGAVFLGWLIGVLVLLALCSVENLKRHA